MLNLSPDQITLNTVNTFGQLLPIICKGKFDQKLLMQGFRAKYEFQYNIWIRFYLYPNKDSACREIRKSELQVRFIIIASYKTRQLTGILLYTDIFRAPTRAMRVILQRKTSVTIILYAPFCKRRVSNKSALSSSARFARRFTAPNDSHHYSTRFLRLGERAPNKGDPLSSSALHSALCASLCSFEWQSLLLYALFKIGRARSEYQWIAKICKKKENLGVPNGAQKSSFLGDLSP